MISDEFQAELKKAEQGDSDAQAHIGHSYMIGNGIEADLNQSEKWLLKSAETNNVYGIHFLGLLYTQFENIKDLTKAETWLLKNYELYPNQMTSKDLAIFYESCQENKKGFQFRKYSADFGDLSSILCCADVFCQNFQEKEILEIGVDYLLLAITHQDFSKLPSDILQSVYKLLFVCGQHSERAQKVVEQIQATFEQTPQ